jgi:geranylgeranyl pyrophosphate synthase
MKDYTELLNKIEEELFTALPRSVNPEWIKRATSLRDPDISLFSANNIIEPCIDLLDRGGKRWRPLILSLITLAYNKDNSLYLKLSPIVELIHNGTLLVDDIEDKAIERRGKTAVHLIYGEDMAINSGNFMYYIPTYIIEELDLSSETKLKLLLSINSNMRRLHFGQGLDIQWHRNTEFIPRVKEYLQMCKFKTGCLASMSAEIAAIISDLSREDTEFLRVIFEEIGVAFQIIDDITNITTGNPGKHRGDDIVEGKKSLPIILYCNNNSDNSDLFNSIKKAKKMGINKGRKYIERAISILNSTNVIEQSREMAIELLTSNIIKLENFLPKNNYSYELVKLLKAFNK